MTKTRTPKPASNTNQVLLAHGGGGRLTDELLRTSIFPKLQNLILNDQLDSGIVENENKRLAMTIDSYVVDPLEFPGGDIGRLAVCGTVNDLAVCGAQPLALALSLILSEGLKRKVLERIMDSISAAAKEAGVSIVTGDTKVVSRDGDGGMYITTSGVGWVRSDLQLHPRRVKPGDKLIINGPIADHGLAVMLAREMPEMTSPIRSDAAPLNGLIDHALKSTDGIVFMRDPTRGGLAGLMADLAERSEFHVSLDDHAIPIRPETAHASEMLGLDPLDVANEGKVVFVVRPQTADHVLAALKSHPLGVASCIIGEITANSDSLCEIRTRIGGRRIVQKPFGEQLPRIC